MSNIAIIPARGKSKRIRKKNVRNFHGFPIIKYSIEAALRSGCFEEVMVSTDDEEIADISKKYQAIVPFMRSEKNSNDTASTKDVILEVLEAYRYQGKKYKYFCCIYPTAPFVIAEKLKESYKMLVQSSADSLIPVVKFSYPIQRALKIENGKLLMVEPQYLKSRSQDLSARYHDVGQFYWGKIERFLKEKELFTSNTISFEIPEIEAQDIDNESDWQLAEIKYERMINRIK